MPYPNLKPSSRDFDSGDFPVKSFRSQSGIESRILYGSRRTGAAVSFSYENISDTDANAFFTHFEEVKGTYGTFGLTANALAGWTPGSFNEGTGNQWRYDSPPQITNVRPGRSTVQIKLRAVL